MPRGEGKVIFKDESSYEGNWKNGHFDGNGKFSWNDGSFYEGSYVDGKKQGFGVFRYASKKTYRGNWVNGKQHGEGEEFDAHDVKIRGGYWTAGIFEGEHRHI